MQWELKLLNEVSAPAQAAGRDLGFIKNQFIELGKEALKNERDLRLAAKGIADNMGISVKELEKMRTGSKTLTDQIGGLKTGFESALSSVGIGLGAFELLTEVFEKAAEFGIELVETIAEIGIELGSEAIHAADFARNTELAFSSILDSGPAGRDLFEDMEKMANALGVKIKDLAPEFLKLSNANFDTSGINQVVAAARDLSLKGYNAEAFVATMARIGQQGYATGKQLKMLAGEGVPLQKLWHELGHTGTATAESFAQLKNTGAQQSVDAILRSLQGRGGVGALGAQVSEGWDGAMNKISNGWESLLANIRKSPGFLMLTKTLGDLGDRLANMNPEPLIKAMTTIATLAMMAAEAMGKIGSAFMKSNMEGVKATGSAFGGAAGLALEGLKMILPGHAEGGLFTSPHVANIAEKGPEYVIPADQMGAMGGRNYSVTVNAPVRIDGAGHNAETFAGIAEQKIREIVPGEIISALEHLAAQGA